MHAIAATLFSISVWIPYATEDKGIPDLLPHIADVTSISPFVYDIPKGTNVITDESGVSKGKWNVVFAAANAAKTTIIPTIIWGFKDDIARTLSDPAKRSEHIAEIMSLVSQKNFDGVDIDYEGKYPASRSDFNAFLSELSSALHAKGKILSCTIEIEKDDYDAMGKACDQVRLMAYDKYFYDFGSNTFGTTTPLSISLSNAPLSFASSAITYAKKYIYSKKIILAIPTYGYDFTFSFSGARRNVKRFAIYSYADALAKARSFNVKIHTTKGGEKYFIYNLQGIYHFVIFSDAETVADRIALAKSLGIGGVAIFKIDGKEDPELWKKF